MAIDFSTVAPPHDWMQQLERVVTPERLAVGLQLVEEAARDLFTNDARHEWVLALLVTKLHIPASVANLIIEIAVQLLKIQVASAGVLGSPAGS
jgi:hypothetical protein